jgi:hypothetical protein
VDFVSTGDGVIAHNLTKGIPFPDNHFDVVYHSHVLEHFARKDGEAFLRECFRVTKPGGTIRVAVPDLEGIVREYLTQLDAAMAGNDHHTANYDWIMLELYDQAVRNCSGGEMASYIFRDQVENLDYVYGRLGKEARQLREQYLNKKRKDIIKPPARKPTGILRGLFSLPSVKGALKRYLLAGEEQQLAVGKFRAGGEIHQWMYDRFSLGRLLRESGYGQVRKVSAFESSIPDFSHYKLDAENDTIHKPDSLFMEAIKPHE